MNKISTLKNITAEQLDDIVLTAGSILLSNINNDGRKAQIDFLLVTCGWTEEEILEELNAELEDLF